MSRITEIIDRKEKAGYAAYLCCLRKYLALIIVFIFISIQPTLSSAKESSAPETNQPSKISTHSASVLPIAMYDSDIGFGTGLKCVLSNYLGKRESSDLLIFVSTKGEQNYALCLCFPDKEIRQGTKYALAADFEVEYDKLLKSNFFGIGNDSKDNEYQFPRESSKIIFTASRALTVFIVNGVSFRYMHYSSFDYDSDWATLDNNTPGAGEIDLTSATVFVSYDSRNSVINPTSGFRQELSVEQAVRIINNEWDFTRLRSEISLYHKIFNSRHIMAYRLWLQHVDGRAPYQELSKIGDSWTARGYKADRFLDKSMALVSAEYRFPIYRKLGGVAFIDDGRVWSSSKRMNLNNWHSDYGAGLRLYLENFVTRLDIGHSSESTRIFLNFGHVF